MTYNNSFLVPVYDMHTGYDPANPQNNIVGYVSATYMVDQWGGYVLDPSGQPYVVPVGYDPTQTISRAQTQSPIDVLPNYQTGFSYDLQRNFDGQSFGGFVPAFTPLASYDFGLSVTASGLNFLTFAEFFGGAQNAKNSLSNDKINIDGPFLNNPRNTNNEERAFQDYYNGTYANGMNEGPGPKPIPYASLGNVLSITERFAYDAILGKNGALGSLKSILNKIGKISDSVNQYFRSILFNSGSDPLAIDLTGNGIKTVGASQSGVMFDTTGSGNTVSTGWIAEGTGWLAYSPSGATTLTSETQLFGAASLLPNGKYATDGFQALSLLDSNGDGVIDAKDPEFANLRVWVGAPSSGSSDPNMPAGQMLTLQQLGIVSISLNEQPAWINTGGTGVEVNTESSYATVTWSDGHQTTIGAVNLTGNPFYQNLATPAQLQTSGDDAANAIPLVQGSGAMYNTRTAAQLSPSFSGLLQTYSTLTSRADQIAMLPQLLSAWGGTSNFQALMERNKWGYSDPCYVYKFDGIQQYANTNVQLNPGDQSNWTDAYRNMVGIVDLLEKFNGQLLYDPASTGALWGHNRAFLSYNSGSGTGDGKSANIFVSPTYSIEVGESQVSALMQGYQALERSVYQGLVLQTRLMPYLNAIGLNVDSKRSTGVRAIALYTSFA
ncbi:hypothetical protein [Ralstonia pseudosolanacearum]|uniref:hypothetical protein n=1 Tax=Ralstonia pseudosolanacearum TaxID=1310165 RepID=UPI001FF8AD48|nr:hypothetical protein [Ralstonia pseudosolanacearum]